MMQIDMQKLEVAMKYIERIADGKNPVNINLRKRILY